MIVDMLSGQKVSPNRVFTKEEVDDMIVKTIEMIARSDIPGNILEYLKWPSSLIDNLKRKTDAYL